uniref:Putative secreted protein n=1 Tax=Anopheles darlingi TaxID=43151 RepID=A0A2M4D8N4_ANODA
MTCCCCCCWCRFSVVCACDGATTEATTIWDCSNRPREMMMWETPAREVLSVLITSDSYYVLQQRASNDLFFGGITNEMSQHFDNNIY